MEGKHTDNIHTDAKTYYADIFSCPHWNPAAVTVTGRLKHPRMPVEKRAAVFASFDALSGYKDATAETARATDERIALSEDEKEKLDQRLAFLIERMEEATDNGCLPDNIVTAGVHAGDSVSVYADGSAGTHAGDFDGHTGNSSRIHAGDFNGATSLPPVTVTCFFPDAKKTGGAYKTFEGLVRKIDLYQKLIFLEPLKAGEPEQILRIDDITELSGKIFTLQDDTGYICP